MSPTQPPPNQVRLAAPCRAPPKSSPLFARQSTPAKLAAPASQNPSLGSTARSVLHIPGEIGFLVHYGVSSAQVATAAEKARLQGVTADAVLIAESYITEARFYRALARHLRLPFVDREIALPPSDEYAETLRSGVARLARDQRARFLFAPRGQAITALAAARRVGVVPDIALATPRYFSHLVRKAASRQLAGAASFDLYKADRNLCAKDGLSRWQAVALISLASLLALIAPWAPREAAGGCMAILCLAFVATLWLRLSACGAASKPALLPARPLSDADLPVYSVIVALYREARVAPQLLDAIAALDYPRAKLDVKIVVEPDDPATLNALLSRGVPPFCEIIVAPPGLLRTKPRALNVALPLIRGELVAIYDAEDVPDPQQLRLAAARFAAAPFPLACLQARLVIDNLRDGWLAQLFAVEYAALFDVINVGLSALAIPFPLGGTSNHFRTAALRQIGGWDAWNVTEDADVGLRLARFGFRSETLASTTYEEAPVTLQAFFNQRRRWCKGWYQTLIVLWRQPRRLLAELGAAKCACVTLIVGSNILSALAAPLCAIGLAFYAMLGRAALPNDIGSIVLATLSTTVILMGMPAVLWPIVLGMRRQKLLRLWPALLLLPLYSSIICAAAWTALYDLFHRPFHWSKTVHGCARRGAATPPRPKRFYNLARFKRKLRLTLSDIPM